MNKNFRVITINGFRGLFVAIFVIFGLFSGFIVTPGFLAMKFWNNFIVPDFSLPLMNIFQGILLWIIFALVLYVVNNNRPLIAFGSYSGLSREQISEVLKKARSCELKPVDIKVKNENLTVEKFQEEKNVNIISNEKSEDNNE